MIGAGAFQHCCNKQHVFSNFNIYRLLPLTVNPIAATNGSRCPQRSVSQWLRPVRGLNPCAGTNSGSAINASLAGRGRALTVRVGVRFLNLINASHITKGDRERLRKARVMMMWAVAGVGCLGTDSLLGLNHHISRIFS